MNSECYNVKVQFRIKMGDNSKICPRLETGELYTTTIPIYLDDQERDNLASGLQISDDQQFLYDHIRLAVAKNISKKPGVNLTKPFTDNYSANTAKYDKFNYPDSTGCDYNNIVFNNTAQILHGLIDIVSVTILDRCHPSNTISGGGKYKYEKKTKIKTSEKIIIKNKSFVVYVGPRGGKYIKKNNKFISIK